MQATLPARLGKALKITLVTTTIGLLAACAKAPPPPPPPPPPAPPPVVEAVPYRPIPPAGAPYAMVIPQRGADGQRITINSNLDENETLWHFRSAWNVAALNCSEDAAFALVTEQYGKFLTGNARRLTAANTAIDQKFRRANGNDRRAAIRDREEHMTSVYNFFASPGARANFCQEALTIATEAAATPPTDVNVFASAGLARYLAVFEGFFQEYESYLAASSAWDSQYGARYGASQPGYVAVYGANGPTVASSLAEASQPVLAGTVTDETGATIPIITVPEGATSSPVVQPVASGTPQG